MKEPKQSYSAMDHVLKYTGIFGGVQGLNILMSIVRNKLASHFLGPVGFALIAIYQSVSEFVGSMTNCGIPFSSVRELAERVGESTEETGTTSKDTPAEGAAGSGAWNPEITTFVGVIRTWCLWTGLAAAFVVIAFAPLLGNLFFHDEEPQVWTIALLAPMLLAASITAGEISILKGVRRLRRVATISALGAVSTLVFTVPFFWSLGLRGILLALNCSTIALCIIHLLFTQPLFPYRVHLFSGDTFRRGLGMVRIGMPYVLAAIAGSGVAMILPALMKNYGSMEDLGNYRAAYGLMVTYAGIVFTAFEADFFPRLSSVNRHRELRNTTINQQIRVSVLLIAPLLIAMMVGMPLVVRLLYTDKFLPAVPMAICSAYYMFLRAITTPIGYTALACGDSKLFLLMEVIYDIVSVCLIIGSYLLWGLTGAGIGLSLSALFDLLLIGFTYGHRYRFSLTRSTAMLALIQALLVGTSLLTCLFLHGWLRWLLGLMLLAVSCRQSYLILRSESTIIQKILQRLLPCHK
ncbi:MAG: oligosaccharide flippase family protein [Bacteroidaceae bacterium]|nr:oligosaccharide flippase family protein [Bacteroidaceae bacterium]